MSPLFGGHVTDATFPESRRPSGPPEQPPAERGDGVDIFIGGGGDDLPGFGTMRSYADAYAKTGRPTRYYPNARKAEVLRAIAAASQADGPVNLVGHSWGAIDAYNVAIEARRRGLRVDNVVTLDPVGGRLLARAEPGDPPANWTNVQAHASCPDQSDWVAALGGKPSDLPIERASQRRVVANHVDVDAMMAAGGRAVLDRSRQLPANDDPADLHDGLDRPAWMARWR